MSVSGIRVAENNLDRVGRPLRAPDSQPANAEELLAELVRLVESSGLGPGRSPPPAETVSKPDPTDTEPMRPLETTSPHASVDVAPSKPSDTGAVDVEPPRLPDSDGSYSNDRIGIDLATGRRAGAWTLKVSTLALVGVAVIGAIFWFKRGDPGLLKAPPFIATAQGPTTVQPRSDSTVATSSGAVATALKDSTQPAQHEVASSEEQPINLNSSASPNNPPPSAGLAPTATGVAKETDSASAEKPLPASANTPAEAAPIAGSPPLASQSLDSKPAPTVLPPTEPTQIAAPTPSAMGSGEAAHASDAPLPPVRPALKAASEAAGVAQRSTPKLDLPTKLSSKSSAHVVVAKADATAPGAATETPGQPPRRGAPVKPEKGLKTPTAAQAPAEAPAAQPEPPAPAQQPNPVVRAFSNVVGALSGLNPFAAH
jgi:hypothetical protein